jgi:hypothetical protein
MSNADENITLEPLVKNYKNTMYLFIYNWSWSHVTTDGRSVSTFWCRAHCGNCDQILILSEICCLVSVGRPLWREVGPVSCRSPSAVIVHRQFFCLFFHFTCHTFYVYTIYARPSQPRLSTADHAPSFVAYTTTRAWGGAGWHPGSFLNGLKASRYFLTPLAPSRNVFFVLL